MKEMGIEHYGLNFLDSQQFPFCVNHFHFKGEGSVRPHKHAFVEMVIVTEGESVHHYMNSTSRIREGDVLVIQPETEHGYFMDTDRSFTGYNILFLPELLEDEFPLLSTVTSFVNFYYIEPFLRKTSQFLPRFNVSARELPRVKLVLNQLSAEFLKKRPAYQVMVKTKMIELFVCLSGLYEDQHLEPIHEITNDLSHFNRLFKQKTGLSPREYRIKNKESTVNPR
jgi:AraC family L-rhamnose operon regulatory protein RhaS